MFVLMMEKEMHLIGVNKINIFFLFILSSIVFAKEIVVTERNVIDKLTLSNGSSITQGGLTIVRDENLIEQNRNLENNVSISQGVILIDDEKITDVHYDIINVIKGYPITED